MLVGALRCGFELLPPRLYPVVVTVLTIDYLFVLELLTPVIEYRHVA